ncbi:MAG: helix-turn-helix domain-containing protein [Nitrososphaerales archaeon]
MTTANEEFLTVREVATLLRKKERTIREWCYSRRVPHYKLGKTLLFRYEEILEWVTTHCRVEPEKSPLAKHEKTKRRNISSGLPTLAANKEE